jgi:adenylate kinase family enzyme
MTLDDLGQRICILGPSGSGKSTLAQAIGRGRHLPVVHLDQLHHLPNTDWQPRPEAAFLALHDQAIAGGRWVIEGNYSRSLPDRLARATGVILLDASMMTSLTRYFRRAWFERDRRGDLEGSSSSVKWVMIRHIAVSTPPSRKRYRALFEKIDLPKILLPSPRELADFYRATGLAR